MKTRPLAWGARVPAQFRVKLLSVALAIGADPSDLMACIAFETGGTFSATTVNKQSGATGLIQFMPKTAIALGTTVAALAKMTEVEQLDYVQKYFVQNGYAGRIRTLPDLYMAILWPTAIGKPSDYVLIRDEDGKAYIQNKGLDLNADGNITKIEAADLVRKRLAEGLLPQNAVEYSATDEEISAVEPGSIINAVGSIAGMLNPAAGILFSAFAPTIKQQIAGEFDRYKATAGAGEAFADALSQVILSTAKTATGKTDDLEAVAVARQNTAVVEQVQQAAVDALAERIKQLAPVLDKSIEYDKAKWQAELESKKATSAIAIEEHKAGLWDMTPAIVWCLLLMLWGIAWGLLFAIIKLASAESPNQMVLAALIGLAGPIWTGAIVSSVAAIVAYRFDGSKQSSDQTKAVLSLARTEDRQG